MIVENLRSVENDLHDIVSGQSVLNDRPFDLNCFIPSLDVLLLHLMNATLDGDPSAVQVLDETQPESSLRSEMDSLTVP